MLPGYALPLVHHGFSELLLDISVGDFDFVLFGEVFGDFPPEETVFKVECFCILVKKE